MGRKYGGEKFLCGFNKRIDNRLTKELTTPEGDNIGIDLWGIETGATLIGISSKLTILDATVGFEHRAKKPPWKIRNLTSKQRNEKNGLCASRRGQDDHSGVAAV